MVSVSHNRQIKFISQNLARQSEELMFFMSGGNWNVPLLKEVSISKWLEH
jgi:hypothetical protein